MSGVLLAGKGRSPNPAASSATVQDHSTAQAATLHEQVTSLLKSDVGELGFLFGHDPGQQATVTPLAAPPTINVTPAQSAAMASGMSVARGPQAPDTSMDTEYANGTAVPVNAPPSANISGQTGWSFRDTLASEVGKIKARVAKYQTQTGS